MLRFDHLLNDLFFGSRGLHRDGEAWAASLVEACAQRGRDGIEEASGHQVVAQIQLDPFALSFGERIACAQAQGVAEQLFFKRQEEIGRGGSTG